MSEPLVGGMTHYKAKVVEHDVVESGTGTYGINLVFEVTQGPSMGQRIATTRWISQGAWEYTEKALQALGWDPAARQMQFEQLAKRSDQNPAGGQLLGREADIAIDNGTDQNGRPKLEVKFINDPNNPGGTMKSVAGAGLQSWAAGMRASLQSGGALPKGTGTPSGPPQGMPASNPNSAPAGYGQPSPGSNIPF